MKKVSNRIISIFIGLLLCISIFPAAYATEQESIKRSYFSVTMQIVSYPPQKLAGDGHALLVFHNDGTNPVTIGHMRLAAGDGLTISTFNTRPPHAGIWYNIEAYESAGQPNATGIVSASLELSEDELYIVNNAINNHNYWTPLKPCTHFAETVWNSVAPSDQKVSGFLPSELCVSITNLPSCQHTALIPNKPINTVAYHTDTSIVYDSSSVKRNSIISTLPD